MYEPLLHLEAACLVCMLSVVSLSRHMSTRDLLSDHVCVRAGKQVLEVGCGVNPLCCLAALRHCRKFVATDGSLQALQGLVRNLDLNCRCVSHASMKAGRYLILFSHGRPGSVYAMLATMRIYIACVATMVRNMCHAVLCCDPVLEMLTLGQQVTSSFTFKTTVSTFPAMS